MSDLKQRIEKMHKGDVRVAWAFVIGLWLAVIFVPHSPSKSLISLS